jgi:hypothetical protein
MDAAEIEALERARLVALVNRDLTAAGRLHADDYQLITPGGGSLSKQEYLELVGSDDFRYETFEPASAVMVKIDGGTAILRYKARIVVRDAVAVVDEGTFWHTDVWQHRGGTWQVAWSQATRIRVPDPEG